MTGRTYNYDGLTDAQAEMAALMDEAECEAETPEVLRPHAYVSQGVPTWRTCAACGLGANARIHKHSAFGIAKPAPIIEEQR